MIWRTLNPANCPEWIVAVRSLSLKYAGTVMMTSLTS